MPSITVAADRPIETICKEIRRRLLPGIQEYHATFLERAKALSLLHDSQGEVAEKLADALDGYKTGGKDGVQFHVSRDAKLIGMEYSTRVLFKVGHSGDDASLDVDNLPVEMAKALAGFIASWMDRAESESSNG
jgi:hypothetical protein